MKTQTILLLGGYGFVGSNILNYIDQRCLDDYSVVLFDKNEKHPFGHTFKCVKRVYAGDFLDELLLEKIFKENVIDIVFHFISSTVPSTSYNAQYDVETNLIPTLKLLDIMMKNSVQRILYLSSGGAIYGDYNKKVHNEDEAVYPKSSYGIVKLAIEKYLFSYSERQGLNALILRLSNPFGRFHYSNKQGVINIAIRKALKKEIFQIWGNGEGVKDYVYIDDVCKIIFKLINSSIESSVYNVASGITLSINEMVEIIKRNIPTFKWCYVDASSFDVQSFELDVKKIRALLGKIDITPFDEAIKNTIEWQKTIIG